MKIFKKNIKTKGVVMVTPGNSAFSRTSPSFMSRSPSPLFLSRSPSPNIFYKNEDKHIPYEKIVPYLKSVEDAIKLEMVSRVVLFRYQKVQTNPYFCQALDPPQMKEKNIIKEIRNL